MAITTLTATTQAAAINYNYTTSGSTDFTGITNNTFFYDVVTKLPYFKDSGGNVQNVFFTGGTISGGLTATTISGGTFYGNGSGLTNISSVVTPDTYITASSVSPITWTVSGGSSNYQATLTATTTTINLTNVRNGDYGTIILTQGSGGSKSITLGTVNGSAATHKIINGNNGVITLSTTAGAIDIVSFTYNGTNMYWTYGLNYT